MTLLSYLAVLVAAKHFCEQATMCGAGVNGRRVGCFLSTHLHCLLSLRFLHLSSTLWSATFRLAFGSSVPCSLQCNSFFPPRAISTRRLPKEQASGVAAQFDAAFACVAPQWQAAQQAADVDEMWKPWNHAAEAAPKKPKGSAPPYATRNLLTEVMDKAVPLPSSSWKSTGLASYSLHRTHTQFKSSRSLEASVEYCVSTLDDSQLPDLTHIDRLRQLVGKLRTEQETLAKHRRIEQWQQRVTTNLAEACVFPYSTLQTRSPTIPKQCPMNFCALIKGHSSFRNAGTCARHTHA